MKEQGNIKWFSKTNNYGYITNKNGDDIYFRLENISSSKDELDKEKEKEDVIPENGDLVSFIQYEVKGSLRAKKIVIEQRSRSQFVCPHCGEHVKPKIVFEQNDINPEVGQEFQQKKPMHTICPNCFSILEEYETRSDRLSIYNKSAILLLIIATLSMFVKLYMTAN